MYNRQTREELNALSLDVFGSSSRWQKLIKNGYPELVTEEVEEIVPADANGENGGVETIKRPVKTAAGGYQSVMKHHTVESVRELMQKLKFERDAYLAKAKAAQEKSELTKKVQEELTGSAAL